MHKVYYIYFETSRLPCSLPPSPGKQDVPKTPYKNNTELLVSEDVEQEGYHDVFQMFVSNFKTINLKIISQIRFYDFVDKYHNTSRVSKKKKKSEQPRR